MTTSRLGTWGFFALVFGAALALAGCGGSSNPADPKKHSVSHGGSAGSGGGTSGGSGGTAGGAGGSATTTGGASTTGGTSTTGGSDAGGSGTGGTGTGVPSAGCGTPPVIDPSTVTVAPGSPSWPYADDDRTRMTINGTPREFSAYIPPAYDMNHKYALIFTFHGCGGGKSPSGFIDATAGDAIVIAPQGLNNCGGSTGWDRSQGSDDYTFFDSMMDWAKTGFCIDTDRVFVSGHSHGGFFTGQLGCWRGDVIRGIAPLSGGPAEMTNCQSQVASMGIHHVEDGSVLIGEGNALRDQFATANHCTTVQTAMSQDPCYQFDGCDQGYPVAFCPLTGQIWWEWGMAYQDPHNSPWAWEPAYTTMWSFWSSLGPK